MFLNPATVPQAKKVIKEARAAAAAQGRDPASLKFFPCIVPIIGRTKEEAQEKYELAKANADPVAGLGQFSGYSGIDLAKFPLDEAMDLSDSPGDLAIQSVFKSFDASTTEPWTPRRLGIQMALGGLHPCPVGTAEEVADVLEEWINEADCDGFNIASIVNPSSWEDVVDLLVPVLIKRGLMAADYEVPGGTFRENLLRRKTLRDDHYGSSFKWEKQNRSSVANGKRKREDVE